MIDTLSRKKLFDEALALPTRAEVLLDAARRRHEQQATELAAHKKAA